MSLALSGARSIILEKLIMEKISLYDGSEVIDEF